MPSCRRLIAADSDGYRCIVRTSSGRIVRGIASIQSSGFRVGSPKWLCEVLIPFLPLGEVTFTIGFRNVDDGIVDRGTK